jgi:hypothetical protein
MRTAQERKTHMFKMRLPLLWLFFILAPASVCAQQSLSLWSEPIADFARNAGATITPAPVSIPLQNNAVFLSNAKEIPLEMISYGSGAYININLELADPQAAVTQAELARSAMAAALAWYQVAVQDESSAGRAVRASVYQKIWNFGEYNVLLAVAIFQPASKEPSSFTFPGPAWKQVAAVERICTDIELRYLQTMQRLLYTWGVMGSSDERAAMRGQLSAAQDAEISAKLNIQPGTINLAPLLLKPVAP